MNGVKKNQPGLGNGASVTVRFALDLAKPTEEGYEYEYSYEQLLEDKLKVRKDDVRSPEKESTSDPFSNDSENLEAIAKRLEEKYGPKKRKRFRDTDLIDRGSGYDVNDSFVDDAELYEDYVPHQLDTKFGGFYVNVGSLEFKTVDDVEEDELDFVKNKKFKPPKIRKHASFQTTPKVMLATQKLKKAKQQMQQKSAAGASLLKVTPTSKLAGRPPISHSQQQQPTTPSHPPAAKKIKLSETEKSMLSNSSKTNSPSAPVPTNLDSSDIMLSANISQMMSSLPVVNLSKKLAQAEVVGSGGAGSPVGEGSGQPLVQMPKEPPKLPAKLPSLVMDKVVELEQMITQAQGADGRLTIKARMSYDKHLVDIHMRCQGLAVRLKNAVLDYLGYKMGVSRLTLVKRMKQELKREEEVELGKSIADLKRAIDAAIPEQMEAYESDMKARAESLSSQPAVEKLTSEEDSHMEEVFEEHTTGSVSSTPVVSSSTQKKLPRKRFKWNEETKKLLCKAVSIKISCVKKWVWGGKLPPDEVVGNFLDIKIKPLWPKGWMQKSILLKMSEPAHKHYTSAAKRAAAGIPAKVDGSSPLKSSTSAMSVSMTTGVGTTVAGHPKPPVSTPSPASSSSAKVIPQTSSAPSLLAGSSDASSIIKELEALKNTSQRNNGKISSGGLGKGLTTTGILGAATNNKKLVAPSKGKLVAIAQRSRSPGSVSPKLKKLLPSSKPSPKGVASTQPLTVSAGAVTASGAASTTGSSAAKVTVSRNTTQVLKQTAPGSGGSVAVTSTNPVSYLLTKNTVSISQFIQDLQKHQLQQQATPTVMATATITSPHPANKSSASNSKMSLSGKAIIAKNTAAPGAKHASPTAKGKPAGSGSAKLHTSKVMSSASPPAGSQISSKQTLPANKQLVSGTLPTTASSSLVTHSNKQQSSTSKQVVSPGSVGQSRVLTVQGLHNLVNQLTSASSSQSAGVKIALQSAATVQPVKEKTSLSLSSQKAQARVSHKVVATSSGQSQKASNLKSGASSQGGAGTKVGGSNVVVGGAGVDGVATGGGRHLSGASTHTNLAVGRTLSSSGASTSSAVVAGKTFTITASRTPIQAAGKTLVSAGVRPGGATTGKAAATGSVSTASSGRPLVSDTSPTISGQSSGNTAGSVRAAGYGGNSSGKTPAPVRTPAVPVVAGSSRTSPVIAGSGTSSTASKSALSSSRTSPAGVTSGRSLPSGAPATNPVKGTSGKTVFAGNPAGNQSVGSVATGSKSVVADSAIGNNSLGKGGITSKIVSSTATGFGGVTSAGKAPLAGGVVSSSTGVSVIDVGRGKEELVRRINSTGTEPAAAAGNSVSSHMPPPLITADALDSDWREHRSSSGDSNVIVITDTPPRPDLPVTNVTPGMSNEQLFIPLSLSPSPSSPMVSPMEQIMEEHSYRTPRSST